MIYSLYIFDSNGCCIFYKEWARKRHLRISQEEEFKMMYGLIISIKSFATRMSPVETFSSLFFCGCTMILIARDVRGKDGFQSFATDKYRFHFYESPSALKFVMMSDLGAAVFKDLLNTIYVAYVETVCRNVLVPARGRMIDSQYFITRLESIVSQSPYFTSKA